MERNWNVQKVRVRDMASSLYATLFKLNHGSIGLMQRNFGARRAAACPYTTAFYVELKGDVLGWAMVFPKFLDKNVPTVYEIHFYVHSRHRGHGIGSAIAKMIRDSYPESSIGGHTEYSSIMSRYGIPSIHSFK